MAHMVRRMAAGAAGLLVIGAATAGPAVADTAIAYAAIADAATAATGPSWHIAKSLKAGSSAQFSAVVATGKTTGWAFEGPNFTAPPSAYQFSGSTWRKVGFPGSKDEEVVTAAATSPSDVWAFTQGFGAPSRVLRYNGRSWSVVKSFGTLIEDATVLASNDVWVYGQQGIPGFEPALGVWHYNGKVWKQVAKSIQGGSALSATNVWGFSGVDVDHFNGAKWAATSLKSLLPAHTPQSLNDPQVVGVLALSKTNVFAIGSGGTQDEGGPVVILHYNGSKWAKVAEGQFGDGPNPEFSYDGHGGLWLPMLGSAGGNTFLVHYSDGKLTKAALPAAAAKISVSAISRVPGSAAQVAGGFLHLAGNRGESVAAVLLKYS
jgi:hypothetical protein